MSNNFEKINSEFNEFHKLNINNFAAEVFDKMQKYQLFYFNEHQKGDKYLTPKKLLIVLQLSYIYIYFFRCHYHYENIEESKKVLDDAIYNTKYYVDASQNFVNLTDNIKELLLALKDQLSIMYYRYACINQLYDDDIESAIDNYKKSSELGYVIATNNLAYIYSRENSPYYNLEEAERLYIEGANQYIDNKYIAEKSYLMRKLCQQHMCLRVAYFKEQQSNYNMEIIYLNKALDISKEIEDKNSILEIKNKIRIAEDYLKTKPKYTSKHEYVVSLFSDKAKKHLTEENYIFIETSLLVYDYLNSLNNDSIDYSSAIISALKCLEQILFEIFGSNYYDYISNLKTIDFSSVPNNFKKKKKKEYINELIDKENIHMELGSFIYACSYREDNKYKIVRLFDDYMKSRGINNFDCKIDEFASRLDEIRNIYRNPTAHKNRISKMKAQDCLDYLLNTIRFINECLENFYTN